MSKRIASSMKTASASLTLIAKNFMAGEYKTKEELQHAAAQCRIALDNSTNAYAHLTKASSDGREGLATLATEEFDSDIESVTQTQVQSNLLVTAIEAEIKEMDSMSEEEVTEEIQPETFGDDETVTPEVTIDDPSEEDEVEVEAAKRTPWPKEVKKKSATESMRNKGDSYTVVNVEDKTILWDGLQQESAKAVTEFLADESIVFGSSSFIFDKYTSNWNGKEATATTRPSQRVMAAASYTVSKEPDYEGLNITDDIQVLFSQDVAQTAEVEVIWNSQDEDMKFDYDYVQIDELPEILKKKGKVTLNSKDKELGKLLQNYFGMSASEAFSDGAIAATEVVAEVVAEVEIGEPQIIDTYPVEDEETETDETDVESAAEEEVEEESVEEEVEEESDLDLGADDDFDLDADLQDEEDVLEPSIDEEFLDEPIDEFLVDETDLVASLKQTTTASAKNKEKSVRLDSIWTFSTDV